MLIDAHSHLDKYGGELDAALEEMSQHRILTISVSMDLPSYQRNLEIAERCPLVIPTFGIHPWQAPEYADRLDELAEPTRQTPMIGERPIHFAQQYPVSCGQPLGLPRGALRSLLVGNPALL